MDETLNYKTEIFKSFLMELLCKVLYSGYVDQNLYFAVSALIPLIILNVQSFVSSIWAVITNKVIDFGMQILTRDCVTISVDAVIYWRTSHSDRVICVVDNIK